MTNILVCGDTHMDTSSICNVAVPKAMKNDCNIIVQVGDFGYWEHQDRGRRFLDKVSKTLVRNNLTMYWLDGNHDNHPMLWEKYPGDSPVEIRPNLHYMNRGSIMNIGPARCLFVGGGYSIDAHWRIMQELQDKQPETLYWPTEMITDTEVERSIRHIEMDGPIDLMFSHDVPHGLNVPGVHAEQKQQIHQSEANRTQLTRIFKAAQPKMLIHGHYHVRYTDKLPLQPKLPTDPKESHGVSTEGLLDWDYCRVDGLSCNGMHGFAVVLDLDSLFVQD